MKARVLSILFACSALTFVANTAIADRPIKDVQVFQFSTVIPAGAAWDSPVRFGEVCAFDVAIDFDDRFLTWEYGDRAKFDNEFNDTFTNLATGFSFLDTAKYSIQFDARAGALSTRASSGRRSWKITSSCSMSAHSLRIGIFRSLDRWRTSRALTM